MPERCWAMPGLSKPARWLDEFVSGKARSRTHVRPECRHGVLLRPAQCAFAQSPGGDKRADVKLRSLCSQRMAPGSCRKRKRAKPANSFYFNLSRFFVGFATKVQDSTTGSWAWSSRARFSFMAELTGGTPRVTARQVGPGAVLHSQKIS